MKNKVILTDCDGVLLDWEYSFDAWMRRHGYESKNEVGDDWEMASKFDIPREQLSRYIRMFNESAIMRKLPPLRDACHYVTKLHREHGFIFHCITSMTDDEYAQHLRKKNLIEMFGPTVFEKYIFLECGADKDQVLEQYRGTECWWVEDKPANADAGANVGLNSLLMAHPHNKDYEGRASRVSNWGEVYHKIVGTVYRGE